MRRFSKLALMLVFSTGLFTACNDENFNDSGNDISELGVKIKAVNSSFSLPVNSTKSTAISPDSITWDTAQMVVSSIKFEAELKSIITRRDSIEVEYKWYGPQMVDLLDTNHTLGNFVLSPGFYDEIELKVRGKKEDAGDVPVFYLAGTYSNNTGTWPIAVEVWEDLEFKTEKENVELTDEGIDLVSEIQIYLDELMLNVDPEDLDNAQLTDGVILISKDANYWIYKRIFENLKRDCKTKYKHWGDYHKYGDDDDDDDD